MTRDSEVTEGWKLEIKVVECTTFVIIYANKVQVGDRRRRTIESPTRTNLGEGDTVIWTGHTPGDRRTPMARELYTDQT